VIRSAFGVSSGLDGNNVRMGETTTSVSGPCGSGRVAEAEVDMVIFSGRISVRRESKKSPKPRYDSVNEGSVGELLAAGGASVDDKPGVAVEPGTAVCPPSSPKSIRSPVGTICAGESD
jgi:hypothetical protein